MIDTIRWMLRGFREETPKEKKERALREVREALSVLTGASIEAVTDEDLLRWLEIYPPGAGTKSQPINYVNNYIEVKPADEKPKEETNKPVVLTKDLVAVLTNRFPISEDELMEVHTKCKNDFAKLTNVLKLMEYTFQSDDEVLEQYEPLLKQYGYMLKQLN